MTKIANIPIQYIESKTLEARIKALDTALEMYKDGHDASYLHHLLGQAQVIEHYLISGEVLKEDEFPKYLH
jgi:hypothetical protein